MFKASLTFTIMVMTLPNVEHLMVSKGKISGANGIKKLSIIYEFSYQDRVFVRISWKSLPGDKHSSWFRKQITDEKVLWHWLLVLTANVRLAWKIIMEKHSSLTFTIMVITLPNVEHLTVSRSRVYFRGQWYKTFCVSNLWICVLC